MSKEPTPVQELSNELQNYQNAVIKTAEHLANVMSIIGELASGTRVTPAEADDELEEVNKSIVFKELNTEKPVAEKKPTKGKGKAKQPTQKEVITKAKLIVDNLDDGTMQLRQALKAADPEAASIPKMSKDAYIDFVEILDEIIADNELE